MESKYSKVHETNKQELYKLNYMFAVDTMQEF